MRKITNSLGIRLNMMSFEELEEKKGLGKDRLGLKLVD